MKKILQLEEAAMTLLGIYFLALHSLNLSVWLWVLLFFAPDIGMLGYLINPKAGAITYNIFHHKGIAIAIAFAGYYLPVEVLLSTGILLFSHSSFDRMLGYGLKYGTSFKDTHLGQLPNQRKPSS